MIPLRATRSKSTWTQTVFGRKHTTISPLPPPVTRWGLNTAAVDPCSAHVLMEMASCLSSLCSPLLYLLYLPNVGHTEPPFASPLPPGATVTWFMADGSVPRWARSTMLSRAALANCLQTGPVSFELSQACLKTNQIISSCWKWKAVIIHNWASDIFSPPLIFFSPTCFRSW